MEFDKSKVYTVVNADELKAGDKVIVADNLADVLVFVATDNSACSISDIKSDDVGCRFVVDKNGIKTVHYLAYLVERVPEKKYRPYKDCGEMVSDFKRRYGNAINADNPMWHPLVWVQDKKSLFVSQILTFHKKRIELFYGNFSLERLFIDYECLDGSPCGIEVE